MVGHGCGSGVLRPWDRQEERGWGSTVGRQRGSKWRRPDWRRREQAAGQAEGRAREHTKATQEGLGAGTGPKEAGSYGRGAGRAAAGRWRAGRVFLSALELLPTRCSSLQGGSARGWRESLRRALTGGLGRLCGPAEVCGGDRARAGRRGGPRWAPLAARKAPGAVGASQGRGAAPSQRELGGQQPGGRLGTPHAARAMLGPGTERWAPACLALFLHQSEEEPGRNGAGQ